MSHQEPPPPKPSYDPGWNDPPTFNYSSAPLPTKTKLNLNKRIAFPMQQPSQSTNLPKVEKSGGGLPLPFARVKQNPETSNTTPVSSHQPLSLPPAMTIESKSIDRDDQRGNETAVSDESDFQNARELVKTTLNGIIKSLATIDDGKVDEIDRRLMILDVMWTDGRINDKLKMSLVKIVEALQDGEYSSAIDIHRSIIVDHGSVVCAQWGPALRQLILIKENEAQPVSEVLPEPLASDEPQFIDTDGLSDNKKKTAGRVIHI